MQSPAIRFDDVGVVFPGGVVAVDGVTIDIAAGAFVALVGASGSGKSTLLKTVNRLVDPTRGRVLVDGRSVLDEDATALRRRIGYVFQGVGLFPHLSVGENIAMPLRLAGRTDPARVDALLDLVELPRSLSARRPDALSGGQRQRVGVARALANGARTLLMDEPFGALDPVTRDTLGGRVAELHRTLGLTTVMVTHDMAEALLLADRVLVMERGRIVGDATPAELLAGGGGDAAQALVAVPRRQMHALEAIGA